MHENHQNHSALLVLDEVQKIPHWSEKIKELWDADTFKDVKLKVILLGSSPLLIQNGIPLEEFISTDLSRWLE